MFTSRICTSTRTSARGLSLDSTIRSMMAITFVVARTVSVFDVLLATTIGCTWPPPTRMTVLMVWASSVASACEMGNVRMACSSYCPRFCTLSGTTRMLRALTTL